MFVQQDKAEENKMTNNFITTNHTVIKAAQVLKQDICIYSMYSVISPRERENILFQFLEQ